MMYICAWQAAALPPERLISSRITLASVMPEPGAAVLGPGSARPASPARSARRRTPAGSARSWSSSRQYASGKPAHRSRTCARSWGKGCSWLMKIGGAGGLAAAAVVDGRFAGVGHAHDKALVLEERRDEPVRACRAQTARTGRLGHRQRLQRAVSDQPRVALDVTRVVAVVVDAMAVVGQRGEAEQQRRRDLDRPLVLGDRARLERLVRRRPGRQVAVDDGRRSSTTSASRWNTCWPIVVNTSRPLRPCFSVVSSSWVRRVAGASKRNGASARTSPPANIRRRPVRPPRRRARRGPAHAAPGGRAGRPSARTAAARPRASARRAGRRAPPPARAGSTRSLPSCELLPDGGIVLAEARHGAHPRLAPGDPDRRCER